jgi:hypothetical protein
MRSEHGRFQASLVGTILLNQSTSARVAQWHRRVLPTSFSLRMCVQPAQRQALRIPMRGAQFSSHLEVFTVKPAVGQAVGAHGVMDGVSECCRAAETHICAAPIRDPLGQPRQIDKPVFPAID